MAKALEEGWISESDVQSCRDTQERILRTGMERSLLDILQDQRLLSAAQIAELRRGETRQAKGRKLGRYLLQARLGGGASGAVFRGVHMTTNEVVAVKVLQSRHADDPRYQEQFQREGEVIRGLNHRNIVKGYETGWGSGFLYVVMEYVEGQTLTQLVDERGPLPERAVCRIGARIASAINYLYGCGVAHCDIKPNNVLLNAEGVVKVSDWGSARLISEPLDVRGGELVLSTPAFMAPEFLKRKALIDQRSDLYALGATLYYCLAGRPPYVGENSKAIAVQLLRESPHPLRALRSDLSLPLDQLIRRLMARSQANRPDDAARVRSALQRLARR